MPDRSLSAKLRHGDSTETVRSITFDEVVVGSDVGISPGGNLSNDLPGALAEGRCIQLEPATYSWDDTQVTIDADRFGLESETGNPDDVTIEPNGAVEVHHMFDMDCEEFWFADINIHRGDPYDRCLGFIGSGDVYGDWLMTNVTRTGSTIGDVEVEMVINNRDYRDGSDAVAIIDQWQDKGPSETHDYPADNLYIWLGSPSDAELHVTNCDFRNTSENCLYTSKTSAVVSAQNCYFENCQPTAIRITGPDAFIENCLIVMDKALWDSGNNQGYYEVNRGIWQEHITDHPTSRPASSVYQTDVWIDDDNPNGPRFAYQHDASCAAADAIDLRIKNDSGDIPIRFQGRDDGTVDTVTLTDLVVTGEMSGTYIRETDTSGTNRDVVLDSPCVSISNPQTEGNVTVNNLSTSGCATVRDETDADSVTGGGSGGGTVITGPTAIAVRTGAIPLIGNTPALAGRPEVQDP